MFTLYDSEGQEQIEVIVGPEINVYYEDEDGLPEDDNNINFEVDVADGEWVQMKNDLTY